MKRFFSPRRLCVAALFAGLLPCCSGLAEVSAPNPAPAPAFADSFDAGAQSIADWKKEGAVSIDTMQPFKGGGCLLLSRSTENITSPVSAVSPSFPAGGGAWDVRLAVRSVLVSPDASYSGTVTLECLDASGKVIGQGQPPAVADLFKSNNWQSIDTKVSLPADTAAARFVVQINKASGKFWIDELSASRSAEKSGKDQRINRLVFSSGQVGNLLYPGQPRTFKLTVEADQPLTPEQLTVRCEVRDYWGAEQTLPVEVRLAPLPGRLHGRCAFEGALDLSAASLAPGRYYELHGTIERQGSEPFTNFTRFATVPEAINNRYTPAEIPFLGRDWDDRFPEHCILSHRMGIRTVTMWAKWNQNPPYNPEAPNAELCERYGLGVLPGTVIGEVESGQVKPETYPPEAMAAGLRAWLVEYGKRLNLTAISLGNEPPSGAAHAESNLPYYKALYDAIKAYNPSITALGTANGPDESYFQAGFGKYLDVYDFHIYEDSQNVALAMQKYPALFQKYGYPKPIWSTELGLNSQGIARRIVAIEMVKKIATFFANGGGKVCWFDQFYPDGDATIVGSSGEAHDMFDSRYTEYCPKLTAVCYYDLINSISIKKFVAQKKYGADLYAFLFRDQDNHTLQILWKDKGRQDVFLPLPDTAGVTVTRLDGSHDALDAGGRGVTLTIGEDPLLLLYDGASPLADTLGQPALKLVSAPAGLVPGKPSEVLVALNGASTDQAELLCQPFWKVSRASTDSADGAKVRFTLEAPEHTSARELDLLVALKDAAGRRVGEISLRPPVVGQFSVSTTPVPTTAGGPGVRLSVKNNGTQPQDVNWELALPGQIELHAGNYSPQTPAAAQAYFSDVAHGSLMVPAGATVDKTVPLAGTDVQTVYQVRSTLTDATGRTASALRNVAGFVGVPKAHGEIKLDGSLDEPDWQRAPVNLINEARQYAKFEPQDKDWGGEKDLSGQLRFLWDDRYLYVGVQVTDDLQGGLQQDDVLWKQDGLQFLIDPCRGLAEGVGKYDYTMAVGKKGPQAWCSLTADAGAPNGEAKDIRIAYKRGDEKTGNITYELAIPWSRIAPFKPQAGGDLGLTMILNEDDGNGRHSFMTWFGNASAKEVATVGDLILEE